MAERLLFGSRRQREDRTAAAYPDCRDSARDRGEYPAGGGEVTAGGFSALVEARAVGRNRFQARCPAHRDRLPSLSIAEGRDGRVLLHCFAGCSTDAILAALKLSRRDLFQGPPASKAQLAALEAEHKAAQQRQRAIRAADREAWERVRRWEAIVAALGAKLARAPDDAPEGDTLTRVYHDACKKLHDAETAALAASESRVAA